MKYNKMAVAVDHPHGFKPFVRPPRCKLQSYSHFDSTMLNFTQTNLTDNVKLALDVTTSIHKSYSTPCLSLATKTEEPVESVNPRIEMISGNTDPMVHALVADAAIALASGVKPVPVSSGLGGAYYLQSRSGKTIAVAKPSDEEPLAINNPKGFAGRMLGQPGMKRSIRVGETGVRELAAYLLDHGGFAGVPPSALVKICHVPFNVNNTGTIPDPPFKITSLQRFVEHKSDAGDLGPSGFSVGSVHRIGILDIRLLNLDRHAGNMLVKNGHEGYVAGSSELVPIDHGFCLPESLDDPYFEWLHWPQASIPFSETEAEYISRLDPFKDAAVLRAELPSIRECSVRVFILCSVFLKRAAATGLSLADIGEMMTREFVGGEECWSVLEAISVNAKACVRGTDGDEEGEDEMFEFENEFEGETSRWVTTSGMKEGYGPKRVAAEGAGAILRSISFAAHNNSLESGECVSFGGMEEDEWAAFLECFEELLPGAFDEKKSTGGLLKQKRMGNSCEF